MQFAKALRPRVQSGEITCSVRIWDRPHVKVGGRYALPPGEIEVVSLRVIPRARISTRLAKRSGFDSIAALLEVAQHGSGRFVFLVEFVYRGPDSLAGAEAGTGFTRDPRCRRPSRGRR